jgi:alpha-tubulin suppressor-like RCC1 family protein
VALQVPPLFAFLSGVSCDTMQQPLPLNNGSAVVTCPMSSAAFSPGPLVWITQLGTVAVDITIGSLTQSGTLSATRSGTQTQSRSITVSPSVSQTPTATPSGTQTRSRSITVSPTASQTPTATPSGTPTVTVSPTTSQARSVSQTTSQSASLTVTLTPSQTVTPTASCTSSDTFTRTASLSATQAVSVVVTVSPTPASAPSGTGTLTSIPSQVSSTGTTLTQSYSVSPTASQLQTPSATASGTLTVTVSPPLAPSVRDLMLLFLAVGAVSTNAQQLTALVAGESHTCALASPGGAAWCWGWNEWGQLGDGSGTDSPVPIAVSGGRSYSALAAGSLHTCALASPGGAAWCWGYNGEGQLGDGSGTDSPVPIVVSGGRSYSALAAGVSHTCALAFPGGAAWCWGTNENAQLGDGTHSDTLRLEPVAVSGGQSYSAIAAGTYHTCALASPGGAAWCWGQNYFGQLGDGSGTDTVSLVPIAVSGGRSYSALGAGSSHSCALASTTGILWCWGGNEYGQIGAGGSGTDIFEPVAVSSGRSYSDHGVGGSHTCALASPGGAAWCWGYNGEGQIGDGTSGENKVYPVAVSTGLNFSVSVRDSISGAHCHSEWFGRHPHAISARNTFTDPLARLIAVTGGFGFSITLWYCDSIAFDKWHELANAITFLCTLHPFFLAVGVGFERAHT